MSNTRHFAEITNLRDKLRRGLAMLTVASMLMPSGGLASEGTNQGKLKCILPEHTHSEACYETVVICGEEERQPEIVREFTGTFPVHVHKADCYDSEGNLICGMVEKEYYHTHSEFCRDTEGNLVCGLQSQPKHSHTEDCRDGEGNLICGLNPDWPVFTTSAENWKETVKDPGHQHTEACYETKLICGLEEHTHTDECYETVMPVSAVSGELQEENKDQTKPEGDDSGENEETDLEKIEVGLEKTAEEVVDFISGHEEDQNDADQNPENDGKSSEELEQTEVENENPVKDKAETDEEPTVPQENGQEEEREKESKEEEPKEKESGDGVTGEGEPEGVEPEDKVTGSEEPGSGEPGEENGKEEPSADGDEVNPLNPTPTDGADIIETEQNPEGQPVEQVQTPEENAEQEIEKIENQGTENPEASPEQNPDKQEPADEEAQAAEQEPADEEKQADEQERADEKKQPEEQETADEEKQSDEQKVADEGKQPDEVNPDGDPSDGESADEETEPVEEPVKFFEGTKVFEGPDYTVTATIGADACFPEDIELAVREILPGTDEYRMYSGQTADAATDEWSEIGEFARFFDITFLSGGAEVEPQAFIDVQITFREAIPVAEDADVQAIHFSEDGANVIESSTDSVEAAASDPDAVDTVNFTVDSFSVYGFFQRVIITTRVITAGGQTYRVEVTYGQDAGIPEGAVLSASEIKDGDEDYELYRAQAAAALEAGHVEMPGLYDISILDAEGQKVQPQGAVSVSITLENGLESEDIKVVHFPEGIEAARTEADGAAGETEEEEKRVTEETPEAAEKPVVAVEVISAEVSEQTVTFETDGFSVYALAYTVDFEHVNDKGEKHAWSYPGRGSYAIADILAQIGVTGTIENVSLTRTVDQGGAENALYLTEDRTALVSEEAFTDTFELTVTVDGVVYLFLITDEQVDNRVTAEVYFLNTDGTRTSNAETESGNTLNARINLSNSSANNGDDTYVKVSLDGLGNYVKLNEKFRENEWDSVVFRDMATGTQYSIGVFYNTTDNSITYRVPPGATGIVALSFTAPNGITPDGTTLTITPSLVDSGFSPITPEENDSIGGPASGKWTSDFAWDPIQKYVNNSKENTVVVKPDGNGAPAINTWLRYDYSAANSLNRTEKGVRWTDHATISDNLTLPEHMSFTGSYTCDPDSGRIYINGAPSGNNILFGLTLKENMRCTALSIDNGTIHYEITVTNPNRDSSTNELTGEMDNISFITELNAAGITLDENYIASGYYGEEIINTVSITETPGTGNDPVSSHDQVKTRTKQDEGFTVDKESSQDGAYVEAGGTIDYTIRVTNTGTVTIAAADSIVTDTLPAAVYLTDDEISRLVATYGNKITINGNNITYRTGELTPNATSEVIIHANVKDSKALEQAGYTNESAITNTAFYRGMSDYVASKLHAGKITAEKTSDKTNTTLTDGETVNFTLTARNDTAYNYTGEVTLTDTLPKYFRVTLFDASGNDITATKYSQPGTYDSGCYIRDSSNHLVPATVVIDWDGRTTVTVRKSDGLAANSRCSVVLTATYDESKVDGRVDDNGNILYTNYVNVNNSQDHTDVTVAVGKIDVDKYVSGATNGGSTVSQPFSDHTEVTYTIHVVNDQSNPYKHDIIVTDTMPRGLVPMGLTVEGTTYESWQAFIDAFGWQEKEATILDGSGSPQSVRVVQAYNGLKLTWTIPNGKDHLIESADITYKALVRTDELVNQSSGLQELGNTVTAAGREDKEIIVVDVKGVEISKKIVGPGGELLDTIEIGPGAVVTYELTIDNPEKLNTTVTGIVDYLPQGGPQSVFPLSYWVLGSTVLVDETTAGKNEFYLNAVQYANNDTNYGRKYWFDNEHNLRFGDIPITSGQEKLVQRITLKYPDDPTVLHAMFTDTTWWGRQQKNRYAISGMNPVEVDHTEEANRKFYLQKSVIGLSKYKNWNYAAISSKDLFNENDVENVFYTVIVANNGTGELHINSLTDVLPPELEFVAIAANDYNAGTQEYTEHAIITSDQNNNPNYVCPSGYTGLAGVEVTAFSTTGNTVAFTLNDGAGVDLPEKHLLAFDVQCRLKNDITLTNGQLITNTIQADIDSDAALSRMSIKTQKTRDDAIQNNGSCTVVSNDGAHQIAESSVTIHPSNAVVPGILKKAIAYQKQSDTGWIDLNDHTTSINSQSKVRWKITLYNDGAVPLNGGYTLSDSIYEHHVYNSIESFTINGVSKETSVSPFTDMTTEKAGDYNLYTFTFPAGDEYTIPAGGKAELVLVTSFTTGQYQGELDNKAAFYPAQEWDANRVIRGQLEKNDAGTEYTGVSSMDYVNMLGDGATMSFKTVTDKNDPINTAQSYDIAEGKNYITVDDTNQSVTYTNHVQNLTNGTFKKFVMIDRMPEIGDTGVVNAHNQRGSEYSIGFADTLNLTLAFRNGDGSKSIALTGEDYTLEFSEKTSFTTEDWEGTSTWNASPSDAKSFRLKLNAESLTDKINALDDSTLKEAVFPSMWVLEVSYDGKLSADGTPGQYAWNSFGYRFTTASDVSLSAEPTKAGVRLKPLPVLKKQVLDSQGVDQGIDTSVQFTFRFYDGQHTLDEVSSLTPIWETTLYQGQAVRLLAQKTVNGVTTGQFIEGQYYTVVEEPVAGYDLLGYEKDGLKQTTQGYCVFKYSNELNTAIVCQNQISGFAPEAEKVLLTTSSRALQDGEFTFELLPLTNVNLSDLSQVEEIGTRLQQAGNDTAGHVQFDNMEFSAAGTYYYLLREALGSDPSICYDDTEYLVVVQVDAAGERFTATGTYYKVTESDDTDPIKAVQPVPAAELPEFINTESTQIEVQKIWAGDATTGTSTMVLYRTIGEQAAVPTNMIAVTFNATLDHTPADSGFITVSYTGSDGSTGSTRLNNANHWSVSLTLDRGVSYDFAYTADGTKILSVEPSSTGSVETTQTIALSAGAKPAENYTYTFTVPSGNRPSKGIVNVTMNGETKQISSSNDWTETFSIAEDTNAVYTVASPNGLITSVTVNEAYNNAPAAGNQTIHVTPTQGDLTMQVPVEVSWSGTPDDGTAVTVTFTHGDVSEQAVLNAPSWSTTKTLDRLDDDGELITWSVSAEVTGSDSASVSGAPDTISDSGSVALTGMVAQGMNLTVIRVGGVNIGGFYYTSDVSGSSISYSTLKSAGNLSGYGAGTDYFSSLVVKDNDGNDIYYILVFYSPVKMTTNDSVAGHTDAKDTWTTRHVVYLKAFPGEITIKLESSSEWSIITGATNISSTIESIPKFRLIASGGTTDSPLGTATTFADASVGGSGTAFSAIHFKDLPDGADVATDIVGADEVEQVIDNGGTYTWSNLPAVDNEGHRIYYYVVEKEARANADEVSVSYAYEYNTPNDPASGIRKVIVTNSTARTRGALTIDKLVTVDNRRTTTAYADGTYSFTITGPENYCRTETITVSGGQATGNITLSDLVPGYYTVTEAETTNGTSLTGRTGGIASGERGIVIYVASGTTAAQNVVTFTNNAETGTAVRNDSVTVNKLDENSEALPGATFTLYSTNDEGTLSDPIRTYGGDDVSSFLISTADIELGSYLPAADQGSTILYLQETAAPAGYQLSDTVHNVEITAAVSGPAYDSASGKWLTTTTYTMTIDGEETANIRNTPVGSLEVTKTVSGTFEAGQTFPFTVTAGGQYVTGERAEETDIYEYTGLSETDPQYTVTKDQTITFTGLPAGTYVVTEGDADLPGFVRTTTYTVGNEDPTDGPASAEVTRETPAAVTINNHYRDAQLIIRKAITGVQEDGLDAALAGITFTVTDVTEGDEITRTPDISVTITSENLDSTDGTYFRTLTSADNGIIPDHKYRITETVTAPDGYVLSGTAYTVKAGTPDADNDRNSTAGALTLTDNDTSAGEIDFTNTYDLTKLTISKAMSGGSSGGTFSFTVDVRKGDGNAYTGTAYIADETGGYTTITFTEDGLYTASVAAGGSLTIYGLPVGYTYTVTEADADGFKLVSINGASATEENHEATGTISAEESTAAFINEELVDIEATKTWYQAGDNTNSINSTLTNAQVTFTLQKRIGEGEWANVDITGNPATKTVTSADPEAWKVSWTNLPKYEGDELISYRVLESGATVSNTAAIMPEPPAAIAEDFDTVEGHVNQTAAVNIDNTLPKTSVVVDKQWYKDGKEIRWPADIASITVGLYQSVNGEEAVPVTTGENKNPVTITFGDGAAEAQRTFSDLPVFDVNGSQIIYSIEELGITPAGDGAAMVPVTGNLVAITEGDSWTVGNGAVSNGAAVVTNTMVKTGFDILKVNGNNETQTLCGAEFTLKKYGGENPDENGYSTVAGYELITVDDHGSASVTGLTDGTYRLYETKAPAGYTAYSGEIEFTITKGEISFRDTQYVTYAKTGDAPGTFTVRNYPGVELPATGGPGTNLLYLLGSMLVMLAGAGFILLQRKKRVE